MRKLRYRVGDIVVSTKGQYKHKLMKISKIEPKYNDGEGLYYWVFSNDGINWTDMNNNTAIEYFENVTMYNTEAARILYGR